MTTTCKLLLLLLAAQLPGGLKPYKPGFSVPRGKVVAVEPGKLNAFARGQKTAVVLVTSEDCVHCRQMEQRLATAARHLREFRFSKLDARKDTKRNWTRVPVLLLYRDGREADRHAGTMSEQQLERWIKGEGR